MFRTKKVIRCAKVSVTWLIVSLLAFDVGSACSVVHGLTAGCCCGPVPVSISSMCDPCCESSYAPTPCGPDSSSTPAHSTVSSWAPVPATGSSCHDCAIIGCDGTCGELSDCCGGDGVVISECGDGGIVDYGQPAQGEPPPAHRQNATVDNVAPIDESAPSERMPDLPADAPEPRDFDTNDVVPMPEANGDVGPETVPMDDLFDDEAADTTPAPADTTPDDAVPAEDSSFDDLFGDEAADTTPAPDDTIPAPDSGLDDLFGNEAADTTPAPADNTTPPRDSGLDDLFGNEAADTTPAPADNTTPPRDSSLDDLFHDDATDTTPAPNDTTPADDSSLDSLFDDAATETAPADAAPATQDSDLDSLFEDAATDVEPAAPAADDSNLDDLFNDTSAEETPAQGDDLDDLFSSRRLPETREISVMASGQAQPLRAWLDNTGRYRTVGRLISIGEDHVRLGKPNGRSCTVPFQRLSREDVEYVRQHAKVNGAALKIAAAGRAN